MGVLGTTLAGAFGMFQSSVSVAICIVHCIFYYSTTDEYSTLYRKTCVFLNFTGLPAMLVLMSIFNLLWLVSSFVLMVCSKSSISVAFRQWVVVTTLVLVSSLVCSTYYLSRPDMSALVSWQWQAIFGNAISKSTLWWAYLVMYLGLSSGTPLMWIANIYGCVLVHRRATKISNAQKQTSDNNQVSPNESNPNKNLNFPTQREQRNDTISAPPRALLEDEDHDTVYPKQPYTPSPQVQSQAFAYPDRRFGEPNHRHSKLIPMAHLGKTPYQGQPKPDTPVYSEMEENYDARFGSPPADTRNNGPTESNFVMKRDTNYDSNPAEIEARMAKIERTESTRTSDKIQDLAARIRPPIYQPTAFEPSGRRRSTAQQHPPLVRSSGVGRQKAYDNTGYISEDVTLSDSRKQLERSPERRGYNSDHDTRPYHHEQPSIPRGPESRLSRFEPHGPRAQELKGYNKPTHATGSPRPNYPDDVSRRNYPDDSRRTNYPEAGPRTNYPEAGPRTNYPEAGPRTNYPEAGPRTNYPEAGPRTNYPEAGPRTNYPDAGPRTNYPDGGPRTNYPDAGQRTNYPDAGQRTNYPDVGQRTNYPDAGQRTNYPDAGPRTNYPDASSRHSEYGDGIATQPRDRYNDQGPGYANRNQRRY